MKLVHCGSSRGMRFGTMQKLHRHQSSMKFKLREISLVNYTWLLHSKVKGRAMFPTCTKQNLQKLISEEGLLRLVLKIAP